MPDDPNERTTYRNGRFINNIFVPNDQPVPEEVTVEIRQPKSFNFDDFYKGRRPQLPDNMAMESRNDNGVYVKPPADFQVCLPLAANLEFFLKLIQFVVKYQTQSYFTFEEKD